MTSSSLVLVVLSLVLFDSAHAFVVHPRTPPPTPTCSPFLLLLGNSEQIFYSDFDADFESTKHPDRDNSESGKKLAREFYETVKLRKEEESRKRERNAQPFSKRQQIVQDLYGNEQAALPSEQPRSSAGFFTGQGQRVFSFPQEDERRGITARNEQNDEFGPLVNERTLVIQLVLVLALLSFYVAVGLSGGIEGNVGADEWILETPMSVENLRESLGEEVTSTSNTGGGVWL